MGTRARVVSIGVDSKAGAAFQPGNSTKATRWPQPVTVLARGSDPPEPPDGLRPGSFVTGPGPCWPGGSYPRWPVVGCAPTLGAYAHRARGDSRGRAGRAADGGGTADPWISGRPHHGRCRAPAALRPP